MQLDCNGMHQRLLPSSDCATGPLLCSRPLRQSHHCSSWNTAAFRQLAYIMHMPACWMARQPGLASPASTVAPASGLHTVVASDRRMSRLQIAGWYLKEVAKSTWH